MNNINNYDLNLLIAFRYMMEIRNVSKVAEQLNIGQSAMSHVLKRLRTQFNDPLFSKTSQGMVPTLRAEELYRELITPLDNLTQALQSVKQFDPATSNRVFIIGTSDYFEILLLNKLIQHLSIVAPGIKLRCVQCNDDDLTKSLQTVDFVFGRFSNPHQNLYKKVLWNDEFVTVVRQGHSRIKENKITLEAFLEEKHVLISPSGAGTSIVDKALSVAGHQREVVLTTHLFSTPLEIVACSDMITTMPKLLAELLSKQGNEQHKIKLLKPPVHLAPFEINIVWGPYKHNDPAHKWFREMINMII